MKKVISTLFASVMSVSATFNVFGLATYAEASSPKVYVDITYETEDTIRADVMLENVPEFANGGFVIHYDEGWTPVYNVIGSPDFTKNNCTIPNASSVIIEEATNGDNIYAIVFVLPYDYDYNGRFISLYFNKTDSYSATNSNISVTFENGAGLKTYNGNHVIQSDESDSYVAPEITQTNEYMIGDLDGDNIVDATDASSLLYGLSVAGVGNLRPKYIENTYRNYFPRALAPAAPDADKNGLINETDATAIMSYYGSVMTSDVYEGQIGSLDIYEYYNN